MTEEGFGAPILTAKDWAGKDNRAITQDEYDQIAAVIEGFLLPARWTSCTRRRSSSASGSAGGDGERHRGKPPDPVARLDGTGRTPGARELCPLSRAIRAFFGGAHRELPPPAVAGRGQPGHLRELDASDAGVPLVRGDRLHTH